MTTFLELKNRYLVTCTLMSEANLHIGSGTEGAAADSGFVTRDGKPFIPGSSLRGVLRSHVERTLFALFPPPNRRSCCLFTEPGDEPPANVCMAGHSQTRKKIESGKIRLAPGELVLCPVCQLFGSTLMAGRLKVSDAVQPAGREKLPVVRDGVGIDRDTETAREKIKFNFELIDPGAGFEFQFLVENAGASDFALLYIMLSELERGMDVGGMRNRGLGRVKLTGWSVAYFDLEEDPEGFRRYLADGTLKQMEPRAFQARLRSSFEAMLSTNQHA